MSLNSHFKYESLDSTEYLNRRLQGRVARGIYSGGWLSPQSGTLNAVRSAFLASGWDGMTVFDLDVTTISFPSGVTSYHVVRAKYNPLGSPATPVLNEEVLTEAQYTSDPDINSLIVIAKVVVPGGATELLASYLDYSVRDVVDPQTRSSFRGIVEFEVDLPAQVSSLNRLGDTYFVLDPGGFYVWDGLVWDQTVAKGAATLDGAYDDNGASPGAGRWITADMGAVEIIQDPTTPRTMDHANAALRLRKDGSTIEGDIGIDHATTSANDTTTDGLPMASYVVREKIKHGASIQDAEPIDISAGSGGPITFTRASANLNAITWGGSAWLITMVEVHGSALGQDGLYLCNVTGAKAMTVTDISGNSIVMAAETGLTCEVYALRTAIGGVQNYAPTRLGTLGGDIEMLGQIGATASAVGKTTLFTDGALDTVWSVIKLPAGSTPEEIFKLDTDGRVYSLAHTMLDTFSSGIMLQMINYSGSPGSSKMMSVQSLGTCLFLQGSPAIEAQALDTDPAITASSAYGNAIEGDSTATGGIGVLGECEFDGWPFGVNDNRVMLELIPQSNGLPNHNTISPFNPDWIFNPAPGADTQGWLSTVLQGRIYFYWTPPQGSLIDYVHIDATISNHPGAAGDRFKFKVYNTWIAVTPVPWPIPKAMDQMNSVTPTSAGTGRQIITATIDQNNAPINSHQYTNFILHTLVIEVYANNAAIYDGIHGVYVYGQNRGPNTFDAPDCV